MGERIAGASVALLVGALCIVAAMVPAGASASSEWPMFGGDARHTGLSSYDVEGNKGGLAWSYRVNASVHSSPVLSNDGAVVFGTADGYLYSLYPNGTLNWKTDIGGAVLTTPAVSADGTIYVAHSSGSWERPGSVGAGGMTAVAQNGTVLVTHLMEGSTLSSPVIAPNGTVYQCWSGSMLHSRLMAFDPALELIWESIELDEVRSSPVVCPDGSVVLGTFMAELHRFNPDGSPGWVFQPDHPYEARGGDNTSPSVGLDGTVYWATTDHSLYAIKPIGEGHIYRAWRLALDGIPTSTPSIGADGTIYIGSGEDVYDDAHKDANSLGGILGETKHLYAVSPEGDVQWKFPVTTGCATPAISNDGRLVFYSNDCLYRLDLDGRMEWRFGWLNGRSGFGPLGLPQQPPLIGPDGMVYICNGIFVSALGTGSPSMPEDLAIKREVGKITLSWAAPSTDGGSPITQYTIARTPVGRFEPDRTFTLDGSARSLVDDQVQDNASYSYTIICQNDKGTSIEVFFPHAPDAVPTSITYLVLAVVGALSAVLLTIYMFVMRRKGRLTK